MLDTSEPFLVFLVPTSEVHEGSVQMSGDLDAAFAGECSSSVSIPLGCPRTRFWCHPSAHQSRQHRFMAPVLSLVLSSQNCLFSARLDSSSTIVNINTRTTKIKSQYYQAIVCRHLWIGSEDSRKVELK